MFVDPPQDIAKVSFFVDPSESDLEAGLMDATPYSVDSTPPFDLGGTEASGSAKPFSAQRMSNQIHKIAALLELSDGRLEVLTSDMVVHHGKARLLFSKDTLDITLPQDSKAWEAVSLWTSDSTPSKVKVEESASWLEIQEPLVSEDPGTVSAPDDQVLEFDTTGLSPGTYTTRVSATSSKRGSDSRGVAATSSEVGSDTLLVSMTVEDSTCSPVPCSEVKVDLPFELDFTEDHGNLLDGAGVGTGFTWVDQPKKSTGYIPSNLAMDTTAPGTLNITTTAGIAYQQSNAQDNAIGVGIAAPNQVSIIETTLLNPPPGEKKFEQAGLWFGTDDDNYVKLGIISMNAGTKLVNRVQFLIEEGGVEIGKIYSLALPLPIENLDLRLRADPADMTITAYYSVDGRSQVTLGQFVAAPEFFSFDAAGINPEIGTRSFGGVYATHRGAPAPVVYSFDSFSVTAETTPPPPLDTEFTRAVFAAAFPTSMVWGPDDRLYILELSGRIRAVTLDPTTKSVLNVELIETLGSRMALGITVDPLSTPSDVILWVSHSSAALFSGELNSGIISRLSGSGFTNREDVITGLPRAIANHATNSIHFGPDGRLYIAQGGNTGGGSANTDNTEFGTRAEQPLSAAFLVADVHDVAFNGSCATPEGAFAPAPCDVQPFATGLRNMYDFTFHTNGFIYGPDNGLGVAGSYPPQPASPCTGFGSTVPYNEGGHNPGPQPDILLKIEQGFYYGHPNPSRNECVYRNGSYQKVSAPPNYQTPIFTLGSHTSSNGTIEYRGNAFDGELRGQILIVNYSAGDDITRIKLAPDGRAVLEKRQLATGFNDPLALAEGPDGTIYVGEFGGGKVTALIPVAGGEIDTDPPAVPQGLAATASPAGVSLDWADNTDSDFDGYHVYRSSDPAGPFTQLTASLLKTSAYSDPTAPVGATSYYHVTAVDLVGNESAPSTAASVTRPNTGTWAAEQSAPAAILDVGGAALDGKLYVVGGKTGSGPVRTMYIYDPVADSWSAGPDLPAEYPAVENPAVVAYDGKLYVFAGSSDAFSGAVTSSAVYDPAGNSWTMLTSMSIGRGGATAQAIGNLIYVVGGMDTNGVSLNSVEIYDPAQNSWSNGPSMQTRRDNAGSAVLNGQLYVFGGRTREADGSGPGTLQTVEMFDPATQTWTSREPMPTGRRVPVVGTLNGKVQVIGGERKNDGSTFAENEEYDPVNNTWRTLTPMLTPRHGAAAGTIDGVIYVAMGGPIGGTSFTDVNESFTMVEDPNPPQLPAAPTGLVPTATEAGISLDWDNNTESSLDGYNVYRSDSASGSFTKLNTTPLTASAYDDTAAPAGVESFYQVTAVNSAGESAPATTSATRPEPSAEIPAAPTGLVATASEAGVNLDWADNGESDLTGYNVYRSDNASGPFTKLNTSLLTTSSYADTAAPAGVESFYQVTAANTAGESSPATTSATRPQAPTSIPLPATIQAEDYRQGGEGAGYHDLTTGNIGGQYRTDDVDIQQCTDPTTPSGQTCYNVGWVDQGEWLAYDVQVDTPGTYTFTIRYATPNTGRLMHIELGGANISGQINLLRTGGWQTWRSVTTDPISLDAGTHTLKVVADTSGFNLNELTATEAISERFELPGTIQVEDYNPGGQDVGYFDTTAGNSGGKYRTDDVDIQQCTDPTTPSGKTCYNVGWIAQGEWLAYDVNVATSGQYTFSVRYATPSNGRKLHIELDGVNVTGSINLPNTGGYQVWASVTTDPISLDAGNHTLRIVIETSTLNLNYVTIASAGP